MGERDADLVMWQRDRESAVRKAQWWPGFFFLSHGLDTPRRALATHARGIIFYDRALRLTLHPFGKSDLSNRD